MEKRLWEPSNPNAVEKSCRTCKWGLSNNSNNKKYPGCKHESEEKVKDGRYFVHFTCSGNTRVYSPEEALKFFKLGLDMEIKLEELCK